MDLQERLYGALLGGAIGDALGIVYEKLAPRRAVRLYPDPTRYHLLLSVGLVSDDAEQAIMTLRALATSGGDPERFARVLATELRLWLATLPPAIGLSTARAGLRLCLGVAPQRSGVRSAGNAPALRGAILGVALADRPERRAALTQIATRITHTDPQAEIGAQLCADLAAIAVQSAGAPFPHDAIAECITACPDAWRALLDDAQTSASKGQPVEQWVQAQGWRRGVSGYILHTTAAALHAWLAHPDDFVPAAAALIRCGGDTDSTAALLGIWMGARLGDSVAPEPLRVGLKDPLARPETLRTLAAATARSVQSLTPCACRRPLYPLRVGRNLAFLMLVLAHALRRALPPY